MSPQRSLRISLIVDPFTLRMKGATYAPVLSAELLAAGTSCAGSGAPPGVIPRSRIESLSGSDGLGVLAFRPDVVIAYDALSPAGWHGMRCAAKLGVPLVAVEEGFPSHGRFFERRLRGVGEVLWGRSVRRAIHMVLALDPFAQAEAVRRGFDPEAIHVVPRGLDLEHFRPDLFSNLAKRHGAQGYSLLSVAPLEDSYRLDLTIQAFASTVGQREDWNLLLAGDGPSRSDLLAQSSRLGVGSRVHWLGKARREELPGLLASSTLLLAPGGERVSDGMAVCRAMACGLPVLAADLPRLRIGVEDKQTGLLVRERTFPAWRDAIQYAASNPKRRAEWHTNSRNLAVERFAWPAIAAQVEELLFAAIEDHEQRSRAAEVAKPKAG
ncbi:MAG: glycosyltransferase [Planctomycetota bacterium]